MTDNHEQWPNPSGPANPNPPQANPPQPAHPDAGQQAWTNLDPNQPGWNRTDPTQLGWGAATPNQAGPGQADPTQLGWGAPVAGQQGWGNPGTGAQPVEYPPYQPQGYAPQEYQAQGYQPQGYQPTQQFYPGQQPGVDFTGQQPVPGYGQPGPPSGGSNRTWLIVAAVIGVVVLVGGGIAAYALTRDDSGGTTAAPTTTVSAAPTSKASPSGGPSGAPKSGSRTVVAPSLGISYDVPSGWTIASPAETSAQAGADGSVLGYGKSSEGTNYCPGSAYRSLAYVAQVDGTDLGAAATKMAKISIEGGYDDPTGGKPGAPTPVTTKSGIKGQQVEASGSWKPTVSGCTTNAYSVYTFAFQGPHNATLAMAILVDRGTTGELAADQAKQMIASLRTS
ncbi:hypothetical protein [Nocardia concava]|uniref:hypothetical protein n=1 Tax=Nocardia concava TaxID=257281 RepID=UPI0012FA26F6|nr:hypothetical protein [Nocardia concava]